MLRFECESCHRLKQNGDAWILGFAAENIGVISARREVSIASTWDDARAAAPLAVHFCCTDCRDEYMAAMFSEPPATQRGSRTTATKRLKRVVPGAVVSTVVGEKSHPRGQKATVVERRKRA